MEADNQNSWEKIRSELDQLSEVPGEAAFNTNAAWNKLSDRLEAKPIHHKPAFYWAAAAILLLLIPAGWFAFQGSNESKLVQTPAEITHPGYSLTLDSSRTNSNNIKSQESTEAYNSASGIKPLASVPPKKKKTVRSESVPLAIINGQAEPKIGIAGDSIKLSLNPSQALVQSTPVKKLKVIHNNQLNSVIYKPELSISNTSPIYPAAPGNFRFSRNASDNILQIKLSSTN